MTQSLLVFDPRRWLIQAVVVTVSGAAMAAEPVLEIAPGQVRPGEALVVDLRVKGPCPVAWLGDRPLFFERHRRRCRAIAGVPVEQPPGELPIRIGSVGARAFLNAPNVERKALAVASADAGSEAPTQPLRLP